MVKSIKLRSDGLSMPQQDKSFVSSDFIKECVITPSFIRESLPQITGMRTRDISPDVLVVTQARKIEVAKSAEQASSRRNRPPPSNSAEQIHSRNKSSSVMSLLQKQFGN